MIGLSVLIPMVTLCCLCSQKADQTTAAYQESVAPPDQLLCFVLFHPFDIFHFSWNKLYRLTQRDSRLAHFSAHEISRLCRLVIEIPILDYLGVLGFFGVFSYFRCKIWRHILALWSWFPVRVTRSDAGQTDDRQTDATQKALTL